MEQDESPGDTFCVICPLCLSSDRNLYFLNQKLSHLTHILNIFSKTKSKQLVCWECYANIKKITRLQSIALHAERKLKEIIEEPGEVLIQKSLSRLTTVIQTEIITVTSRDMEKEIEESSPSYLPSSPSVPSSPDVQSPPYVPSTPILPSSPDVQSPSYVQSPSSLPPMPPLHPSPSLSVKCKQGDVPKLKTALKPVYVLVETPKTSEKSPPAKLAKHDITITKLNTKKNIRIDADQLSVGNKKMLNTIFQSADENPKTLLKLGKMNNDYDKRKMHPKMEINCKETIVISDSEANDISDRDTPIYLSCDDNSDLGNEELRYDSEHESIIDLTLLGNDKLTYGFDSLATIAKTSNLDIEQQKGNKESLAIDLNNDIQENTNIKTTSDDILDNDTVQEVKKRNISSEIMRKLDDIDEHAVKNVDTNKTVLRNNLDITHEDTQKQNSVSKNTIHNSSYCTADNVDEEYIYFVQTKEVSSEENYLNSDNKILSDDNNIKRAISSCDFIIHTLTDIQSCVGNNTDSEILNILNHNENSMETITLPQIQLLHDRINHDQQYNKKNETQIETVYHETIINEKLQKYSACQTLLGVKAKQQLIVNKITADMPWKHAMDTIFNKDIPKTLKSPKAKKPQVDQKQSGELENEQGMDLKTLKSLEIIMMDHWYDKEVCFRLKLLRKNISKAVTKAASEKETQVKTLPLILRRKTTIKDTEINDVYADEVWNDHSVNSNTTNYCENEQENVNSINYKTGETRNLTADDTPMSSVNMSVSIDLREFFPESPVYDKNLMSNNINMENDSVVENENLDYSLAQYGIDQEEMHIKPEPIDSDVSTDSASEVDYYIKNNKINYYDYVPVQNDGAAPRFDDQYYENLELKHTVNNWLECINDDSDNLKTTEDDLLKPLHIIDWVDETYSHVVTKNTKRKSHKSVSKEAMSIKINSKHRNRAGRSKIKGKRKTKDLEQRKSCETQNKHESVNEDYNNSTLLRKRVKRDSHDTKEASMQEKINELYPLVESDASYNTSQNIIKKDCYDIKADIQEKINDDKLSLHRTVEFEATVESEANYNLNQKRMKKDSHDIKEANMQDNINDKNLSLHLTSEFEATVESEVNYQKRTKKDGHDIKAATLQDKINDGKLSLCPITESETNYNSNEKYMNKDCNDRKKDKQEIINNNKLSLYPTAEFEATVEADANYNPNRKRMKKDCHDTKAKIIETINHCTYNLNKKIMKEHTNNIRDANIIVESDTNYNQNEKINVRKGKRESQEIKKDNAQKKVESEGNNNPNQPNNKNETNQSTVDKIAPIDYIDNKHEITLNELERLPEDEIVSNTDSKEIKEPSNETNIEPESKCSEKITVTLLPKTIKTDSEETKKQIVPAEVSISKLLLYPVVELEKNEYLHRHCETRSEAKELNETETTDPQTNENKLIPTDFIENNKEITLDDIGEFSDDELVYNEDNKTEELSLNTEFNEEEMVSRFSEKNSCSTGNNSSFSENNSCLAGNNSCSAGNNSRFSGNNSCPIENNVSPVENELTVTEKCLKSTDKESNETKKKEKKRTYVRVLFNKTFHCFICKEEFTSFDKLLIHQKTTHVVKDGSDKKLICFICQKYYKKFGSLLYHQRNKHKKLINLNHNSTKTLSSFLDIQLGKQSKSRNGFTCFICNDIFESYNTLLNHQMKSHNHGINNDLSLTENSLCLMGNNVTYFDNNLPTADNDQLKTENNVTSTENNFQITGNELISENILSTKRTTTEKIVTFTGNNQSQPVDDLTIYNNLSTTVNNSIPPSNIHVCFLCNKRYKRFDSLLVHQNSKHIDKQTKHS